MTFSSFGIAAADRQSHKTDSAATLVFSPSAGGAISILGTITVTYPANFFLTSPLLLVSTSSSAKINCTSQAATFLVLTVQDGIVPASAALTVTLRGMKMGRAMSSVLNSISVKTSHDANDVGVAALHSGPIGDRVSLTSFAVSLPDRVAGKGGSTATLVFAPSVGGEISVGGNITLSYPAAFFQLEPTPSVSVSGISSLTVTSHGESSVVLTVQSGVIASLTSVTITLAGFKMGNATAANYSGISVITTNDANTLNVTKLSSGHIGDRVTVSAFVIANDDRVESKGGVAATLTFIPSLGGEIVAGGWLTLYYPPKFFDLEFAAELPVFSCSAAGVQGVVGLGHWWIAVTTSGAGLIAAGQPVVVTLSGLKMGPATAQNATGLSVYTSQDQVMSAPFDTGTIGARVTLLLFAIKFTDAVAGKLDSSATITFRTSAGGVVPPGGRIIVKYYIRGFFSTSQIPLFSSSVPGVTGTCAFNVSNQQFSSIVVTTSGSSVPASSVVTITLAGLTMGGVSDGGPVVVDTSADHESLPGYTGPIYSRQRVL